MARYTESQFTAQQASPAAPEGLKQESSRWQAAGAEYSRFAPTTYAGDARSWFGGRNVQGTNSGWDSTFVDQMFKSYDDWNTKVAQSRRDSDPAKWLSTYDWLDQGKNPGGTGIAFWDDPEGRFKVGDVVTNGRAQPGQNVYEAFDRDTANLMLAPFMFSGSEQARFNRDSRRTERYEREVAGRAEELTKQAGHAETALEYQADVYDEKQRILDSGATQAGLVGATTAGGAALGAGIGTLFMPVVGTAIGGVAGGLIGGVAGFLNRDALVEELARGRAQADRARDRYGPAAQFAAGMTEWGGVARRAVSPFGNAVQGTYDAFSEGGVGDGSVAFQETDETGARRAPGIVQALDLAAAFGDGIVQFASPAGRMAYVGTMGLSVAGSVGTMATTGAGFNVRTGEWDPYEGAEWVFAMGNVGIDALQMGIGAMTGRAVSASRAAFGGKPLAQEGTWLAKEGTEATRVLGMDVNAQARRALGMRTGAEMEAAIAGTGERTVLINGMKYTLDAKGTAIRARATATILVPSEFLPWVATTWHARTLSAAGRASQGGNRVLVGGRTASDANRWVSNEVGRRVDDAIGRYMPGPDDYYRAALSMSSRSTLRTALLNGYAEGWEEAVQAIFEPKSFSESIRPEEVLRGAMYGFASGAGMGLAGAKGGASNEQKQFSRAHANYMVRKGVDDMSADEFRRIYYGEGVSDEMRRRMAIPDKQTVDTVNTHLDMYKQMHTRDNLMGSSIGVTALNSMRAKLFEKLHKARNPNIEGSRVLMGMWESFVAVNGMTESARFAEDSAVQSLEQTVFDLRANWKGLEVQQRALEKDLARWRAEADRTDTTPEAVAEAAARRDAISAELAPFPRLRQIADEISSTVLQEYSAFTYETDAEQRQRIVDRINRTLSSAYELRLTRPDGSTYSPEDSELAKRAVELRIARHPVIDVGASAIFRPQVSMVLTQLAQDATTYIHQSRLKAMGADHDGDQGVLMGSQHLTSQGRQQLRRGAMYLQTVFDPSTDPLAAAGAGTNRVQVVMDAPDGHKSRIDVGHDALTDMANTDRMDIAARQVDAFVDAMVHRYVDTYGIFSRDALEEILEQFADDILTRQYDAQQKLLDAMFNAEQAALLELADTTHTPEMLWIQGRVGTMWNELQRALAVNAGGEAVAVSSGAPQTLPEETAFQEEVVQRDANSDGMTLTLLLQYTTNAVRQMQGLHYSPFYRSAVEAGADALKGRFDTERVQEFIALFEQLGAGQTQSAMDEVTDKNPIEDRVVRWLSGFLEEARRAFPDEAMFTTTDGLVLLANMAVPDVRVLGVNQYEVSPRSTTLLQVLLKKSIAIEEFRQAGAREDADVRKRIARLKELATPQGKKSTTANRALIAVFGNVSMVKLAGRAADGVGGHLTPNQLVRQLTTMGPAQRTQRAGKWRRLPAYLDTYGKRHDPPYALEEYVRRDEEGQPVSEVNAFKMVMDAVIAEGSAVVHDMGRRDERAGKQFRKLHTELRSLRLEWERTNQERLLKEARKEGVALVDGRLPKEYVLADMLDNIGGIDSMIASILPDAAMLGIFHVDEGGKVWTARWLREMLVLEDVEKAELMMFLHTRYAELNQMGGKIRWDPDVEKVRRAERAEALAQGRTITEAELTPQRQVAEVDPRLLKSRFLQVVYGIAENDQTGFELDRLLALGMEMPSLEKFMEAVNNEPNWVGDMAPLMAYHDEVSLFEDDPSEIWKTDESTGQQQREAIRDASKRMARISSTYAKQMSYEAADKILLANLESYFTGPSQDNALVATEAGQLQQLLVNARLYPDTVGAAARDQFMEMVQQGTPRVQDKGAPDPAAEGMGQPMITQLTLDGYTTGFSQELSAQTSHDWQQVLNNLTGLAQGPARIMMGDGSFLTIDLHLNGDKAHDRTVMLGLVKLLQDPRTRAFARAVIAPTVRDVDKNNVVQHYTRISTAETDKLDTPLKRLLADSTLVHLFPTERLGIVSDAQADQTIGMLESGARMAALGRTKEEQTAADNIVQKILNDFLVAYMTHPEYDRVSEDERRQLKKNVATVLQNMTLIDEKHLPEMKRLMQETLKERYLRSESAWSMLDLTRDDANLLDIAVTQAVHGAANARYNKLMDDWLALPQGTPQAEVDAIGAEIDLVTKKLEKYTESPSLYERVLDLPPSVSSAIHMWTQFINDETDLDRMADVRISLLQYLNTNNRMDRIVEKDVYRVAHDVRSILHSDPTQLVRGNKITQEQWTTLALAAATTTVAESAATFSSGVGLERLKLDPEGERVRRLYDRSWSYLLDGLFDKQLQQQVRQMATLAKYRRPGVDLTQVMQQMDELLFSERKLGPWVPMVVTESLKAEHALGGATVLGGVQVAGVSPPEWRDAVGATWVSYGMPDPAQHHSALQLDIPHTLATPGTLVSVINPFTYLKLEHHFVQGPGSVTVTDPNGVVHDWFMDVTDPWMRDDDVVNAGYRVFRGDLFDKKLTELQRVNGEGTYTVNIEYVDVDKKPQDVEHINSVLFDGAGPSDMAGMSPGPIAEMIFGAGGISKVGQQGPLDFAAKMGAAFRQILTTDHDKVVAGESRSAPLAEILAAKASAMWAKEYETGRLPLGANNAVYRLIKLRHVVRGKDAEGNWVYLWSEDVIRRETMGEPLPFVGNYELIPLSTPVLQTLLGRSGLQGTQALTMPELNIQNVALPLSQNLNAERLEQLGLSRLGEVAELGNTSLSSVVDLSPASTATKGKGREFVSAARVRFRTWQGEIHQVHGNRALHQSVLDRAAVNAANRNLLRDMTRSELLAQVMAVMGVPYPEMHDMGAVDLSDLLEKSLDRIMGKNGVTWVYRHSETPDATAGILGRASLGSDFLGVTIGRDRVGPVHGDAVVLDLDDLQINKQNGDRLSHGEAKAEAKRIIRALSERGVTIVLGAKSAQHLRSDLAQWMRAGEVNYVSMKGSSHFFEPARIDTVLNRNIDALESTLTEVRQLSTRGVNYRLVTDFSSVGLHGSENATLYDHNNADQIRFKRVVNVLAPAALTGQRVSDEILWNLPERGEGLSDMWARLRAHLVEALNDPAHIAHLKMLSGGDNGNPLDVPLIVTDATGRITNGVLSFDDAMERFKGHLNAGTLPTDPGQTLMAGDFYAVMSATGQPLLLRYGFKIPDWFTLQDQLQSTLGSRTHVDGGDMVNIGIGLAKIEEVQTIPPPLQIRRTFGDAIGIRLEGEYNTSVMTKDMLQQLGFKAGYAPMPANFAFPIEAMNKVNGLRVISAVSEQAVDSKQATNGMVRNLREAFVLTGIDFRHDLVEFLFGAGPRTEQQFRDDWARAKIVLNAWSYIDWGAFSKENLQVMLDTGGMVNFAQHYLNGIAAQVLPGWTERNFVKPVDVNPQDVTSRIGSVILATLMLPGVRLEHVSGTRGMLTVEDRLSDAQVTAMPPFLTEALNNPRFKETRQEMFRRINANAGWPTSKNAKGETVPVYQIDPDFTFKIRMRDPTTEQPLLDAAGNKVYDADGKEVVDPNTITEMEVEAKLQRILSLPFEKDSASVAAAQLSQKSNISPHVATVSAETVGAWTALDPGRSWNAAKPNEQVPNDLAELFGHNDVIHFDTEGSSFHEIFARMRPILKTYNPWERRLPGQQKYLRDAQAKMVSYFPAIKKKDGKGNPWSPAAEKAALEFLSKLNMGRESLYEVDILVRQFLGAPGVREEGDVDIIDERTYRQVVKLMGENVEKFMHPLHGGAVPMESESFWAKVFDAQRGVAKPWSPEYKGVGGRSEFPTDWEQWVHILLGQTRDSTAPFHGMFRMDLDGFLHTFQGSTPTFNSMPLSFDTQRDLMLMDPETNTYLISMDPLTQALWASPMLMSTMDFTLNTLTGHDTDLVKQIDARSMPGSSIAEQLERQERWLKGHRLHNQKPTSVRKYFQNGLAYLQSGQETSNFFLALNHLQIINRLANPGLWVSAVLEVPYKNMLEHFTNLASGSHLGTGGVNISRAGAKVGLEARYSPQEIKLLRQLAESMGSKTEFRSMLFGELLYKDIMHKAAPNKFNRWLETTAATVARSTGDPRLGMFARSAALRYIEAALEYEASMDSSFSVQQFVKVMQEDPLWLERRSSKTRVSAHSVGINRVARVRGTRQSAINKATVGKIDKLERSGSVALQGLGFMLNVPFRFKRFNIGTFLTLTGLDGFDQMFAMMRDKRPEKSMVGRLQAAMRGEEYVPQEFTDYSDVIEGIDLSRPFVRGGLTQTLLLAGAMFAGNLGLDGEDEEAKRRRRMMTYLNGAYLYDPRKAENDFLYADALFLDSIPGLNTFFMDENGRSAIVPHWILRQFTSPLMGIQRFMNTGDIREIGWGFQDGISAIPYSVLNTWNQAQIAADMMTAEMNEYMSEDTPEAQAATTQLFINIAAVYEKALLENSFVNGIRNGADEFDRDPYKEVQRDEHGNILRDSEGNPLPTSALMAYREPKLDENGQPVLDENGQPVMEEVKQAYDQRTGASQQAHVYAENNFTFSLLASLFTGQINPMDSSFARRNMAVKEQKVEIPEQTQAQAETLILSAYLNKGGQEALTLDEIIRLRKAAAEEAGIFWNQADIEAEARTIHDSLTGAVGGMSALDDEGNEVITQAGAGSIYQSLRTGMVRWEDDVLQGVVIPWEMRDKIASEWIEELIQDGVNMGMSEQGAQYYAKRIWFGDSMNPDAPGLKELLYDKRIPGTGTVRYNQLNMTYMIGPDGRPWATPFTKQGVLAALGVPLPQTTPQPGQGMSTDIRGKSVDEVLGINTGLHGLVRKPTEEYEPPEDQFDKAAAKTYTPGTYTRFPRRGFTPFPRGGGGGFSSGRGFFDRMQPFPRGTAPDLPNVPFINTTNPFIRRAEVRRQRITSERERLKQWQ